MAKLTLVTALLAILLLSGCSVETRLPTKSIEQKILKKTPLGSTPDVVMAHINTQGWKSDGYVDRTGFLSPNREGEAITVGESHIRAHMGSHFWFPLGTESVTVFWGFDKNQRLIEVYVWKTVDTL